MKHALSFLLLAVVWRALSAEPDLVLENRHLRLRFDGRTGAWTGLTDKVNGEELVSDASLPATLAPPSTAKLDKAQVVKAVAEGRALSLTGEWLYTPLPPVESESTNLLAGRFEGVKWAPTAIPSRRGVGDDRLHERTGDFWYRRQISIPETWMNGDLALVIGAVDDFDVAYINGTRIGETGQGIPWHWEAPRFYRFPARLLRPGQTNTLLLKVTNAAFDGGIDEPVALGPVSALNPPRLDTPPMVRHALVRNRRVQVLNLVAREGAYEYYVKFVLPDDRPSFTRQLLVSNASMTGQLFQTASYQTPPLSVGRGQAVVFPGSLPVGDVALDRLTEGEFIRPRTEDPLALLWDANKRRGLGVWFHCEEEFSPVSVQRIGAGARLRHEQGVIIRLWSGDSVALGRQFFWLAHGSRDASLAGAREVYRAIGLRTPADGLPGLRGMAVYCGHPGGPPELNYLKYGGFKAMSGYVPTLHKMGIDLLWLLPIWEHGDGTTWNLYSPFDHFQVDHLMGTADELRGLSRDCATNGIRLMFDLVPHGPPAFTPLAKEHPDWVARTPEGSNQVMWSQLAFDNNHPGWQDYMRRAAEWGAREFGAVGARVDCGAGGPLNWNSAVTRRPSLSSLAAGLGMNRAIREGYERVHRGVVVLPEEYTGARIFERVADLTYDAQFYYLQADLLERDAPPEEWARSFQQFLHDQQQTLPAGALKMRWISNHDTVSWTFQKRRPATAYGVERMRALLALCAFIEGVPMLYQGDEDPSVYGGRGEASVDFLARIYGLRKRLPALREGSADYVSAKATGGVFSCLRSDGRRTALVLISLNPQPVASVVSLRRKLGGQLTDALSGECVRAGNIFRVAMRPYQVRVLTARSLSLPLSLPEVEKSHESNER